MFPQISWLKIKISKKLRHGFLDKKTMIATTLTSSCHWKTLAPFCLHKTRPEKPFLTLRVSYRKIVQKNIMPFTTTVN